MGITAHEPAGVLDRSLTEADLDAMIAAEKQRRADLYDEFERVGTAITFRALGVQVLEGGDTVYTIGSHESWNRANTSRALGALAGAQAQVTDAGTAFSPGMALLVPLAIAPLARKATADAVITFTEGTVHIFGLDGSQAVRDARKQCVQFNVLAGTSSSAGPAAATDAGADDAASRLRKLQELLEAGLVTRGEYDAKRAAIIDSL